MTTDNKTLADVQPGGRVRLGDQRSDLVPGIVRCAKCAFQLHRTNLYVQSGTVGAGDSKTEPCPNGCGPLWPVTWETWVREGWAEAERLHLENAALSAQPSPGGQGDALKALDDLAAFCSDDTATVDRHVAVIRAALAASQPVGNYEVQTENGPLKCSLAVYAEWQKNEEYIERLKAELAVRQPVGEPVCNVEGTWLWSKLMDWCKRMGAAPSNHDELFSIAKDAHALYAAPHAEAVDLGAVRALLQRRIEQWRSHLPADPGAPGTREIETKGEHDYNNDVRIYREGIAVMEEVLSKVDSQAVGK